MWIRSSDVKSDPMTWRLWPTTPYDWLKKLAPLFHPIRSKTKPSRDYFALVFPRFRSATGDYFKFWLVHCIVWLQVKRRAFSRLRARVWNKKPASLRVLPKTSLKLKFISFWLISYNSMMIKLIFPKSLPPLRNTNVKSYDLFFLTQLEKIVDVDMLFFSRHIFFKLS